MKQSNHIISAGARGLVCAGLSTVITAFFSWSFVASTDTLDWMGSSALSAPQVAVIYEDTSVGSAINLV
jgi:hypothetical protein